jgi:FKBP-type peptidyl-prolyl cis-trans isomerase FklB
MMPKTLLISSLVSGFATAVQNMHIGDRWLVYIPYDLGYGTTESSSSTIPAYSTLVFDITLVAYYRSWTTYSAKAIGGTWVDE